MPPYFWSSTFGRVVLTVLAACAQNGMCLAEVVAPAMEGPCIAGPWLRLAPNDEGQGLQAPALLVAGLTRDHRLCGNRLSFQLDTMVALDLAKDSDGLVLGGDSMRVSLKPYWTFDPRTNSFTIDGVKLQQFLTALPAGELDVSLNFVSADGEFAAVYQMPAVRKAGCPPFPAIP